MQTLTATHALHGYGLQCLEEGAAEALTQNLSAFVAARMSSRSSAVLPVTLVV